MLEELLKIEMADVDALAAIKSQVAGLQKLVDNANSSKDKVAASVYARVMKDYDTRLKALEDQARPLRAKARGEFTKLRALHSQLKQKLDGAQLDQSELEFRHEIGELSDDEFQAKRKSAQEALAVSMQEFDEADHLSQRFLEVIPAVPEPPAPPAPAAPAPALSPAPAPARHDPMLTDQIPVPGEAAPGPDFGTVVFAIEDAQDKGPPREDFATAFVPRGRLVEDLDGKEGQVYSLGPLTTVGRTPENDIALDKPEVSRRHAQIVLADDGFTITDNGSGNGTYVNDARITKHKLKNGDRIQFGTQFFLFREQ
jgi:FHA domain